ncbi:hypothetical protein [Plastoroseomonas hellenica]|uniref:hypothetical protein n=1 Tax=Plastoroseomonas hellenica TaxID=2687306 RepID=UPI001BAA1CF5|nr:hypothetical protein [Plastoroseomonas hellenica]MBR0647025.1 hypothetical protein [Plastoroseomonas hellenica]
MTAAPRAVVVHDAAQARAAIAAAGGRQLLLLSAPGAAGSLGPAWFAAILAGHAPAAIDCGTDPGHALAALRFGFRLLVLAPETPAFAAVAGAAAECGATLLAARPEALDLAGWDLSRPAAQAALARWLDPPLPRP